MNLISARVKIKDEELLYNESYASNPIREESSVIEGSFYKEAPITMKDMITRKVNKSLCVCLAIAISITFASYYIAINCEAKLNNLDKEIVRINTENQDLQAELDKYKSFNNVDNKIEEYNLLQKAEKVIEVTALNTTQKTTVHPVKTATSNLNLSIGY